MKAKITNCKFSKDTTNLAEELEWVINNQCLEQIALKNPFFNQTVTAKDLEIGAIYYLAMTINMRTLVADLEDTTNGEHFGSFQIELTA